MNVVEAGTDTTLTELLRTMISGAATLTDERDVRQTLIDELPVPNTED